jgi:hypothetical protein
VAKRAVKMRKVSCGARFGRRERDRALCEVMAMRAEAVGAAFRVWRKKVEGERA